MIRPLVVIVFISVVLLGGTVATVAAVTNGDEVASGSEVYVNAADSDNGEQYVQIDENDEVRLQFNMLPPGSQTRVDDLFVVGFAGYENSDSAATVRLESTDDRLALTQMDTGESFSNKTVEIEPGGSVLFGAVVSTSVQGFSSTIELEVDVPETDGGSGSGGGSDAGDGDDGDDGREPDTGDGDGGSDTSDENDGADDGDSDGADTSDDEDVSGDADDEISEEAAGDGDGAEGESDDENDATTGADTTNPSADSDVNTDDGAGLIELAGFGTPVSLIVVSALVVILSLSYAVRLELIAGGLTGGSE